MTCNYNKNVNFDFVRKRDERYKRHVITYSWKITDNAIAKMKGLCMFSLFGCTAKEKHRIIVHYKQFGKVKISAVL